MARGRAGPVNAREREPVRAVERGEEELPTIIRCEDRRDLFAALAEFPSYAEAPTATAH